MSARVERPDLEALGRRHVPDWHELSVAFCRLCDCKWPCDAYLSASYALQLEQDAAGLRAVADAAAAWKDGTNFRRCDYRCQHVDCALAALLAAAP